MALELPDLPGRNWWLALVTFERRGPSSEILPDDTQGACGWLGCLVEHETDIRDAIEASLAAADLRLVEIGEWRPLGSLDELSELDEHLAENIMALEAGKRVVWGTIHTYFGDGEA